MSDSLWPHGLQPTRLLHPWDFPGKSAGVDCHFLLQGIFPIQGSNPGFLHCRQILYSLSHQGTPQPDSAVQELPVYIALHSSTLAWKIPQTEEPGKLQSMESQRVGHDWATSLWVLPLGSQIVVHSVYPRLLLPSRVLRRDVENRLQRLGVYFATQSHLCFVFVGFLFFF